MWKRITNDDTIEDKQTSYKTAKKYLESLITNSHIKQQLPLQTVIENKKKITNIPEYKSGDELPTLYRRLSNITVTFPLGNKLPTIFILNTMHSNFTSGIDEYGYPSPNFLLRLLIRR